MPRLAVLALVFSLGGVPVAGTLLCGVSCPEAAAQPAGCHGHRGDHGASVALTGAHTCDHVAAAAPGILRAAPAVVSLQTIGPVPAQPAGLPSSGSPHTARDLPPGACVVVIPLRSSVLRI